jgi:hypothetical protein
MLSCSVRRVEGGVCLFVRGRVPFSNVERKRTSVIAGHRMPERSKSRAETGERMMVSYVKLQVVQTAEKVKSLRQERGWTYDAMSGDGSVIADTLKLFG